MKVLHLYAGIGGNRKLWKDVEVTAVEIDPKIAEIYQDFFPNDNVIIDDAHKYLLKNYEEYDFIWSSPPCPTHSRMRNILNRYERYKKVYPDMTLYEEILFLKHFFKGKYCVENVISYYDPLIKPQISNNHYFWCNFVIGNIPKDQRMIEKDDIETIKKQEIRNRFNLSNLNLSNKFRNKILNNCVKPEVGLHILEMAFNKPQLKLTDISIGN